MPCVNIKLILLIIKRAFHLIYINTSILLLIGAFFGDTIWVILSVEPSGTLALTQQMDKFHDLGTRNRIHSQGFSPSSGQHSVSRANDVGMQNGGLDNTMNPFASSSMYTGTNHVPDNTLNSTCMLPPSNLSTSPGISGPFQLQNAGLNASPSSSFTNPHLLMRRPSSPTDSDQPIVSARNILARKISESPIDRGSGSVLCNGDSSFAAAAQTNICTYTTDDPSNNKSYESTFNNKCDDEEME